MLNYERIKVPADIDLDLITGAEAVILSEAVDLDVVNITLNDLSIGMLCLENNFSQMSAMILPNKKELPPKLKIVVFEFEPEEEKSIIALVNVRKFKKEFYTEMR